MKTEMYRIVFSNDAKKDLGDVYSRRITHELRLVYRIYDEVLEVLVLSAFGHYKK